MQSDSDGKAAPSVSRCVGNFQNKINFLSITPYKSVTRVTCVIRVATFCEVVMNEMIPTLYASSLLLEGRIYSCLS